jgi:hypothetical protein
MLRKLLLLAVCLAGCSKGPEADTASIGEARSLAAEWALVNAQAQQGHLTRAYVVTMRKSIREQLESAAHSLTQPQSPYGREIALLLREPGNASPTELRTHADKLKQIEDGLESA